MHAIDSERNETIKADLAYEQPYRFKLWLAVVEDSATLGMGFRAYLSHIRSSLHLWERSGVAFVSAKNQRLNLDALKADDLWGFLGKKSQQPQGPKRNIDPSKIAVLDVYIKKKYPTLAATFGKPAISPEVAAVLRSFFDRGLALEPYADYVGPWSGVYVSSNGLDPQGMMRARRRGEIRHFVIRAIMLRPSEHPNFCVAQKVILPLLPNYLHEERRESSEWKSVLPLIARHKAKDTIIYTGIALAAYGIPASEDIRLSLMLRDRTTYNPSLGQFVISRFDDGFDETNRFTSLGYELLDEDQLVNTYSYCGEQDFGLNNNSFSLDLFTELDRLYTKLGEES